MMSVLIIFLASKLHIVIVGIAVLVFLLLEKGSKRHLATLAVCSLALSYVLGKGASILYFTERPFAEMGIVPLVPHIADNGFPSEHTLYAMVIALVVYLVNKNIGMLLVACAVLVGVGRVLAEVHRPVDVLGAIFVALISVSIVRYIAKSRTGSVTLQET